MKIKLNDTEVEVLDGETILETARRIGLKIPSLCYAKGAVHKSSCMVCAVKNRVNGQIIPSCSTLPVAGMQLDTESEEVQKIRTMSLELLLSDHRADCEAPCTVACPNGLDVEHFLALYDAQRPEEAFQLLAETFDLPSLGCDQCKAPCEKICRRGTVDKAVAIREIIREVAQSGKGHTETITQNEPPRFDKTLFNARLGRFTQHEKEQLQQTITSASHCLHCACSGKSKCQLRLYATSYGIKRSRYDVSSVLPAKERQHITKDLWFEPAKCIRCGLCVYNSDNGFTFIHRGFSMEVLIPEQNKANVSEAIATLCPTGALYVSHDNNKIVRP